MNRNRSAFGFLSKIPTPTKQRYAGMTKYNHAEFNLTHKRAEITAEERRLIDEAVAAGKVQTVPTGKTTLEPEYIWGKDQKGKPGLVMKNPLTPKEMRARWNGRYSAPRKPAPAISARRAEVLRLTREGYTNAEVAKHLGCDPAVARNDRRYLQAKGELPKLSSSRYGGSVEDIKNRRQKVLELVHAKTTNRQIAETLGVSKATIEADRVVLRAEGKL